jgi:hypothetical protein
VDHRPLARRGTNCLSEAAQAEGLLELVLSALSTRRNQFELYAADCDTLEQDREVLKQKGRRKQATITYSEQLPDEGEMIGKLQTVRHFVYQQSCAGDSSIGNYNVTHSDGDRIPLPDGTIPAQLITRPPISGAPSSVFAAALS